MGNEERKQITGERKRGKTERKKTAEDDRKTGDLSINYNATATRDSRRNSMQRRSHSDMRVKETRSIWRFAHGWTFAHKKKLDRDICT